MTPKLEKLLRLALDPASPQGEFETAAVKFIREARFERLTVEQILSPQKQTKRQTVFFEFGKHRGCAVGDVPSDYLLWAIENIEKLNPLLRRAIEIELEERGL